MHKHVNSCLVTKQLFPVIHMTCVFDENCFLFLIVNVYLIGLLWNPGNSKTSKGSENGW